MSKRLDEIKAKYDFEGPLADGFPADEFKYLLDLVEELSKRIFVLESALIISDLKDDV